MSLRATLPSQGSHCQVFQRRRPQTECPRKQLEDHGLGRRHGNSFKARPYPAGKTRGVALGNSKHKSIAIAGRFIFVSMHGSLAAHQPRCASGSQVSLLCQHWSWHTAYSAFYSSLGICLRHSLSRSQPLLHGPEVSPCIPVLRYLASGLWLMIYMRAGMSSLDKLSFEHIASKVSSLRPPPLLLDPDVLSTGIDSSAVAACAWTTEAELEMAIAWATRWTGTVSSVRLYSVCSIPVPPRPSQPSCHNHGSALVCGARRSPHEAGEYTQQNTPTQSRAISACLASPPGN